MRTDFIVTENMWRAVLLILSGTVLLVTVWCLVQGITIIFMHLFYVPIVLLAYHYRRTGFWLALLLSVLYLALVAILVPGDSDTFVGAVLRALVFVGIAAIVVYLVERHDAEEALRQSEEKFRAIADYTVDWEVWFGPDGRCRWVNSAVKEFTGYSPEEILAMPDLIAALVAPEDRPAITDHFQSAIRGSRGENIEFRYLHRNGTIRWIAVSWQPVLDAGGNFLGTRASGRDITDKKRVEEALMESEEKYRTLFERADDAVIIMNETAFLDCNPAALRLYRTTRDGFVGRSPLDFSPEIQTNGKRSDERAKEKIQAALGGAPQTFYWVHTHADGTPFDAEVALNRIVLKGQVLLQAMVRDISGRKQLERALFESESRLRSFIESTGDSVVIVDEEGMVMEWNPASERITGIRKEETVGRYIWDVTIAMALPEHRTETLRAAIERSMREMLSTGTSIYSEPRIVEAIRPDGTRIATRQMIFPIRTEKGFRVGSIAQDVTSERAAAAALEESNRRLATLIASLQGMVYRCRNDPDWTLEFVSEGCVPLTGYSPEEFLTKRSVAYGDLIHPDDRQYVWDGVQKALATRSPYQLRYRLIHRDGTTRWVGEIGQGVFSDDGSLQALEGYNADITTWQYAEEALAESGRYNRSLIEAGIDPLVTIGQDGRIQDVNAATERATGRSRNELIGTDFSEYFTNPEKAREGYLHVFSEGKVIDYPLGIRHRDGHVTPVLYNATVYHDRSGNVKGVFAAARDITERKLADAVREALIHELAQKNAELDRFTYTVSHDLKSPLIAIRAFLTLLQDDLASGNAARAATDLQHIAGSAEKLEELINTLLTLSRSGRTVSTPLPVPFADVVKAAADLLSGVIGRSGAVLSVDPGLPVVMGDRERLIQVMTNLIDNAVKFMGDQKNPQIEIGIQQDGSGTVIFVRDNGMGIRPDDLPRVFGLYERFYPDVPGTGIGLATVKRIIEAHGGKIWAESEGEGKGTTFFFTLPGTS